jgi:carbon-monoxide dehydrogenase large subunit
MSHGAALYATALEVVKKGLDLACEGARGIEADLEFQPGKYRVKGTDVAIAFGEIVKRYGSALDTQGGIPTPTAFPGGAHVCEVEIDPETGTVEVASYVAVDDCGRVMNHTLVEGQLHGGIVQGVGQALAEHCVYDAGGQLLTGSFMDYAMPRSDILGKFKLYDHSVPSPTNPLGVKGTGEAGTTGAIPCGGQCGDRTRCVRSASTGWIFPYSPRAVWQAMLRRDEPRDVLASSSSPRRAR